MSQNILFTYRYDQRRITSDYKKFNIYKQMKKILQYLFEHKTLSRETAKEVLVNLGKGVYNEHEISAFITIFLMLAGLYIVIARNNLVKKLVGLAMFQTAVFVLFISMGKVAGGTAPILDPGGGSRRFRPP